MSDKPTPERSPKHDRKLAVILTAAAQVFAEIGFDRASIRMVADRAKVSVAGLYYYVRSKEELLFLIQQRVFTTLVERFKADRAALPDPADQLACLIRNHLEHFIANMSELIVCSREFERLGGKFRAAVETRRREYFTLAMNVFEDLRDRHEGIRVDPRTATLAMFGTINWIYTWYRPNAGATAEQMADEFVCLYLRGVLPNPDRDPSTLAPPGTP